MSNSAMVTGAFLGDAISLGPHWVYDQEEISRRIVDAERYQDPISPYHPGKKAGDFTHYGDQVLVLLRYVAEAGKFDLTGYAAAWRAYWENPATISYRDGSTKGTLANLEAGVPPERAGAHSHDLSGAGRFAPLFLLSWNDDAELLAAVRNLTAFTHNHPDVIAAAEFFATVALAVKRGEAIPAAIRRVGRELDGNLKDWLAAAEEHLHAVEGNAAVLATHGLSCDIDGGFAGVCHLLLRYPDDPTIALVENAMAGGDSAARALILGTIYGAADLIGTVPEHWLADVNARAEIGRLTAGF
jgi:ADP-ribosylglycohydrolase